jgi:hypothetical protein
MAGASDPSGPFGSSRSDAARNRRDDRPAEPDPVPGLESPGAPTDSRRVPLRPVPTASAFPGGPYLQSPIELWHRAILGTSGSTDPRPLVGPMLPHFPASGFRGAHGSMGSMRTRGDRLELVFGANNDHGGRWIVPIAWLMRRRRQSQPLGRAVGPSGDSEGAMAGLTAELRDMSGIRVHPPPDRAISTSTRWPSLSGVILASASRARASLGP